MIKAVLIDIDNTLLDFVKCSREAMVVAAETFGINFPENYFEIFTEINDGLWDKIEKGELTRKELLRIRWKLIFEEMGIAADGSLFDEEFRSNIKKSAIEVDGAKDLLQYLSGKYYVCVASNSAYEQQKERLRKGEMLPFVREIFTSEEIGFTKPKREFFEYCKNELPQFEKEEIIVIGDSVTADIEGAKNFGFRTCWFNYKKIPDAKCEKADYIVNELSEIRNIL